MEHFNGEGSIRPGEDELIRGLDLKMGHAAARSAAGLRRQCPPCKEKNACNEPAAGDKAVILAPCIQSYESALHRGYKHKISIFLQFCQFHQNR